MLHLYTPWKQHKIVAFLMFSGDTEVEHWLKMACLVRFQSSVKVGKISALKALQLVESLFDAICRIQLFL